MMSKHAILFSCGAAYGNAAAALQLSPSPIPLSVSEQAVAGAALAFAAVAISLLSRQGAPTKAKPDKIGKTEDAKTQ